MSLSKPEGLSLEAGEIDGIFLNECFSILFSGESRTVGHVPGCTCALHSLTSLSEEKGETVLVTHKHGPTLQQFSTPWDIALKVAAEIATYIPEGSFVDLGAGNAVLSAALLLRNHRGIGVELDPASKADKLEKASALTPMGTTVPFRLERTCVCNFAKDCDYHTDYVVMNPPFQTNVLYLFFEAALRVTDLIFCLMPADKTDQGYLQKLGDKFGVKAYPLDQYDFPIRRSKPWHTRDKAFITTVLVAFVKTNEDAWGVKEAIESREPRTSDNLYTLFGHNTVTFNQELNALKRTSLQDFSVMPSKLGYNGDPENSSTGSRLERLRDAHATLRALCLDPRDVVPRRMESERVEVRVVGVRILPSDVTDYEGGKITLESEISYGHDGKIFAVISCRGLPLIFDYTGPALTHNVSDDDQYLNWIELADQTDFRDYEDVGPWCLICDKEIPPDEARRHFEILHKKTAEKVYEEKWDQGLFTPGGGVDYTGYATGVGRVIVLSINFSEQDDLELGRINATRCLGNKPQRSAL